nr:unnamed protein product [Digitaria exilis]
MEIVDGNNGGGSHGGLVVTELSHIKELVRQLDVHLGGSHELCKILASQIFSLTERSISIITSSSSSGSLDGGGLKRSAADAGLASPFSATPTSGVTDGPFKNAKKRKVMEKRRHQVRVSSPAGDNPVEDGHSWRKYGQKEILGAKNPSLTAGLTVKTEGLPPLATTAPFYLSSSTPASIRSMAMLGAELHSPFSAAPSTSENWGVSPATSDSNHVASYLPLEDAEWRRGQNELQEVVSALVAAGAPPAPAMDSLDELLDIDDIASFFA